ncbi:MAG: transcriptional regulator [Byssovorax sp.]
MLRLVHPAPEGQGTVSPTRRKRVNAPALSLTAEETRHLRAALRNAVRAFGGFPALAQALSLPVTSLYRFTSPKRTLPGTFAVRLAKVLGISVESILTGTITAIETCPTCGHRPGTGRIAVAAGGGK